MKYTLTLTLVKRLRLRPPLSNCTLTGSGCKRAISLFRTSQVPKDGQEAAKTSSGSSKSNKAWNEAACVMTVAPMNNSEPYSLGYLLVERSGIGRVMPGNWVFPGGNTDPTDSHLDWIPLFQDVQNIDIVQKSFLKSGAKIPEIYSNDDEPEDHIIPKEVSLRITAVREMFEEAGVLLCRPRKVDRDKHLHNGMLHYEHSELQNKSVLQEWQKKVKKNSIAFIELCRELDCVPDLDALHDWSNWLSPTIFKPKVRFDAMNYMIILPKIPRVVIDGKEAVKAQWVSPSAILADYAEGQTRLMPPQLYEMSRMKSITTIDDLQQRLNVRRQLGIERFFPVFRKAKDGTVILLPGDDLYPANPDVMTTDSSLQEVASTVAEMKETSRHLHRAIVSTDGKITNFDINVERFGNVY